MKTKYIGGFTGDLHPVAAREVDRVIRDHREYGTLREARRACRIILARGDVLRDQFGFGVRLRLAPRLGTE